MFTGIIEETGKIRSITKGTHSLSLVIQAEKVLKDTKTGDSIAVNGVCLTVTGIGGNSFTADVMHETLNRSSMKEIRQGHIVNLERAMGINDRFGGHIVSGHIDGIGSINEIKRDDNAVRFYFQTNPQILRYIIEKGSIAIDGISLTVTDVTPEGFGVSVIPHTLRQTALAVKQVGNIINIENDCIGKYVEKLLMNNGTNLSPIRVEDRAAERIANSKSVNKEYGLTRQKLLEYGF